MLKAEWQDNEAKPEAERVLLEWCSGDLLIHITEGNMHSWLESFDSEQQVGPMTTISITYQPLGPLIWSLSIYWGSLRGGFELHLS